MDEHAMPRWGVMLPSFDPYRQGAFPVPRAAELAEQVGFDSGWVGDHLAYHPPTLDAACALAAAAAVTEDLWLGTGVLLLALRNPAWAAKQIASVDALAPGRVVLGVGVGGEGEAEFAAAQVPLAQRGRRLEEALGIVTRLLAGEGVDHKGPLIPITVPRLEPVPARVPPIVIGGRSEAALDRAARLGDAWMAVWMSPDRLRRSSEELAAKADRYGRRRPDVLMLVFANVTDDVDGGWREAAQLVDGQYGLPLARLRPWLHVGPAGAVADAFTTYRDAGADGVVVVPMARDVLGQIEALAPLRSAVVD